MIGLFTKYISTVLVGIAILSSCSRPMAYFQHTPVESYTTQTVAIPGSNPSIANPIGVPAQVNETVSQLENYVRNDSKLATNKKVNERMVRVKNLLSSTAGTISPKASQATRRMNVAERLILKKMSKQIGHQLAPTNPDKALVKTGQLIGGLVLLVVGLLLLILGTGTVAFIGLIVALVGAVGTVVSLLGIDS